MHFDKNSSLCFNSDNFIVKREQIRDIVAFELGNHSQLIYKSFLHNGGLLNPTVILKMIDLITFACLGLKGDITYQQIVSTMIIMVEGASELKEKMKAGVEKNE